MLTMKNPYALGVVAGVLLLGAAVAPAKASTLLQTQVETHATTSQADLVDAQTSQVAMSSTSVALTYPVNAKLFGVFPLTLSAQAMVASNGSVEVRYPWYSFLFSTDRAQIDTKVEAVGKAASTFETESLNTNQQVVLLALLHAALKSSFEVFAATSAETHVQ